ncbi:MAG: DUF262 domain-containing protein [Kofleriaceae bacterium]
MAEEHTPSALLVRPEVVLLEDLFEEIKQGRLRSPRFQRPFVWSAEDMRKLFESVIKGYPIGSLLIWEPGERYEVLSRFGPIAQHEPSRDRKDLAYVLDGQHRLATLFGATHVEGPPSEKPTERVWWMWYDLDKEEFTHSPRGAVGAEHLPLGQVLGTTDFLQFCSRLLSTRPKDGAMLVARAERLTRLLRAFRVPVVRIRGGGLADASEIFSRLNSSGRPMATDQIVSALTYREGEGAFDLASRITEILEGLGELHFSGVARSAVLRSLAAIAGIRIHSKPGDQVANFLTSKDFTDDRRELVVRETKKGMTDAAEWLSEQGVKCDHLLPYALQLVLLTQLFSKKTPDEREARILRQWLFATSFSGWFAGGNTTQINTDLAEMAAFAEGKLSAFTSLHERAKAFPKRFDLRAARVRAFLLATMIQAQPKHQRDLQVDVVSIFNDDDAASVPKIFTPRDNNVLASTPANRILLPSFNRKGARQQLLDLQHVEEEVRQEILRSHCIDDVAWKALLADDMEGFVQARTEHLIAAERAFMESLGIEPPDRDPEEAVVDTGD